MESLNELIKTVKTVVEISNRIDAEIIEEIWDKAPLIIHQRFCHELTSIVKKHDKDDMTQVAEYMDILKAIEVLENLYPILSKK